MPKIGSHSSPKGTNTLLNYFNKKSDNKTTNGSSQTSQSSAGSGGASSSQSTTNNVNTRYQLYDLVWAKLEGYPWWPSIVCPHPTTNTFVKRKGKTVLIHVQFFDDPVSRAWIRERDLKDYFGKHKSDVPLLKDAKWNQSIEFADQALKMEADERWTLIADLMPSDGEEDIQLIDNEFINQSNDETNKSLNQSSKTDKESPKSDKKVDKSEHKSDLKRKNSQRDSETKDRKKFKSLSFDSSEDEPEDSDDEFKVNSTDESDDVSDEDVKDLVDEASDSILELDSSDSEPKSRKRSKSNHKSKSKKKSVKTKSKKSSKKSRKRVLSGSSESDVESVPSDICSESEPESKSKRLPKNNNKSKKSFDSNQRNSKKKTNQSSDSDVMNIDSDTGSTKAKKVESSTPKAAKAPQNWLTQRTSAHKSTEKKTVSTPKSSSNKQNKSLLSTADESFINVNDFTELNTGDKEWPHFSYEFLKPDKIKDKSGRFRLNNGELNPVYDPTTVLVPQSFLKSCTPAMKQWWDFKADHFDTILFFKMGKFYELFHMDAVIAVNELQIQYMRGESAHAGFPEKAYKRYADVLIQKNYKVARIEQTETPQMMEERVKHMKGSTKFDRVVNREMCRVSTIGTRIASVIDADSLTDKNSYLMAITENVNDSGSQFGVCFIDVSIGKFHLSQFSDDRYSSSLRTLVAHNPPIELLFDKKCISQKTKQLIENCVPNARKEVKKEFWSSKKTLKYLTEKDFFGGEMPKALVRMLDETDLLQQTSRSEYELAIRSFGAVIEHLTGCLIEEEVLSMKLIEEYNPCDSRQSADQMSDELPNNMILDSFTLRNLEIFQNSLGGTDGTLSEVLDFCSTPFGRRLLQKWICAPICNIQLIQSRQTAVAELSNVNIRYEVEEAIKVLKKLPDLERLLSKIHSQGSAKRAKSHPDSRAILFESDVYSKRKISDFLSVLDGFKSSMKMIESFQKHIQSFKSSILIDCLAFVGNGGRFPDLKGKLKYFDDAFDHKTAKQEGKIVPQTGADAEYDLHFDKIESITKKFDQYLLEQRKVFACKVNYFGTGKNRYQLEVPDSAAKAISKSEDYLLESSRKGFKRYSTPYSRKLFEELLTAEEAKDTVLRDIMRRIFETFDKHYNQWLEAIQCLSLLDVLLSLSKSRSFLQQNGSAVCQPKFIHSTKPMINLIESSNPCLLKYCNHFIPNDIQIESQLLLLTGPNMGGKSTLMRQLGLIVVMAQIGAYVPAKECTLSPVDRIFTRIGAFDRIVEGESTFFVELSETALVLKHSTKHSLVLIDELGRGTSTFDGTAIACAVTKELSENIRCRTLFSSHYHSLVDEFKDNPSVKLVHMACMIENENETDPTEESITFLYKLKADSCPKSYGFNAAQLAGIPKEVIRKAFKKAKEFERQNQIQNIFTKVIENNISGNQIMELIPHLKSFSVNN